MAGDLAFDPVRRRDARQHLGGDRRRAFGGEIDELPPDMAPTEGELDAVTLCQPA